MKRVLRRGAFQVEIAKKMKEIASLTKEIEKLREENAKYMVFLNETKRNFELGQNITKQTFIILFILFDFLIILYFISENSLFFRRQNNNHETFDCCRGMLITIAIFVIIAVLLVVMVTFLSFYFELGLKILGLTIVTIFAFIYLITKSMDITKYGEYEFILIGIHCLAFLVYGSWKSITFITCIFALYSAFTFIIFDTADKNTSREIEIRCLFVIAAVLALYFF